MRRIQLLTIAFLCLNIGLLRAQSYSVNLHRTDGNELELLRLFPFGKVYKTQLAAYGFIKTLVPQLQELGYLAASIDSVKLNVDAYDVFIYLGDAWRWARLSFNSVPAPVIIGTGLSEAQYSGRNLSPKQISRLTERVLAWCENNGYPFARAGLDSVRKDTSNGGINANLSVDLGPLRRIDSLIIEGDVRLSKPFIMRYLDVYEGGLYNEARIQKIAKKLRDLPFIREDATWQIAFRTIDTKLYLKLRERRANQLNAIIGLQPNTVETGKFLLTADVQAAFQNLLGNGELLSFSYQKLQAASPRIKAEALYPYMLGTPFGADGHFDLYFRGTDFRRTTFDIGGRYSISAQDYIRLYYRGYDNRIISPDTNFIRTYHRLPDNIDVVSGGGGMELQTNRTDYRLNPTRGWTARIGGEVLRRNVQKNDGVTGITDGTGFDFTKLYDTLTVASYQYQLNGDAAVYFPLKKRIVLKVGYYGGWISGDRLFQNELYQIGGFKLLRGFDEGSLFANQYHMGVFELRFLISRNSNVYLFSDNAWLQSKINNVSNDGLYSGFGLGTLLETNTGQFTIAYGLGNSTANPVQFRQSKIHIGYVAYF